MFLARVLLIAGNKDGELPFLFLDIFEDIGLEGKLDRRFRRFLVIFIVGFILFGHLYLTKMGCFIIYLHFIDKILDIFIFFKL
jgi:hypothetical protein